MAGPSSRRVGSRTWGALTPISMRRRKSGHLFLIGGPPAWDVKLPNPPSIQQATTGVFGRPAGYATPPGQSPDLPFPPLQPSLGKDQHALASIQGSHGFCQFRSLPAKRRVGHSNNVENVLYEPVDHREVEKQTEHHGRERSGHFLNQPERIEPAGMVGEDQDGSLTWKER